MSNLALRRMAACWLLGGIIFNLAAAGQDPGQTGLQPVTVPRCIILLHGLGRSSVSMKGVEWRLENEGFSVINQSYPWQKQTIQQLATLAVENGLDGCREQNLSPVGFVTHSLGGILLRQYLEHGEIKDLGRVVMLAPPNQGSTMADYLLGNELIEPLLPEPAHQLGTDDASVPLRLGPVDFELGVIAGSNSRLLVSPGLDEVPNDGTVAVDETRVEGMRDFIVLDVDHSFLMWRGAVLDQVVQFLRTGSFDHSRASEAGSNSPSAIDADQPGDG